MSRGAVSIQRRCAAAAVSLWIAAFPRPVAGQTDPASDDVSSVETEASASARNSSIQSDQHAPQREPIEARPLDGVRGRELVLVLSDDGEGDADGAVTWTSSSVPGDIDRVTIQFFVEVEGRGLLAGSRDVPIPLDVYGYLVDDAGTVVSQLSQQVPLVSLHQAELLEETGLKFVGELTATTGRSTLRVLIRNRQTRRYYLGRCVVEVPTRGLDAPLLLPPLVPDRAESWVIGLQQGLSAPEVLSRLPGIAALPSAKPTWRAGEPLEVVLGGSDLTDDRRVSAQLLNRLGHPFLDADLDLSPYTGTTQGLTLYRASISAPDAPVGEYRLEIVVMDEDSTVAASQVLPVLIHNQADLLVWTDPAAPRPSARQRMASEAESPAPRDPATAHGGELLAGEGLEAPGEEPTDPPDRFVGGDPDEPPPSGPVEALALSGVGARGAALLLSGQRGGEVHGAVVWTSDGAVPDTDQVSIKVVVEIDGGELLTGSRELPIPIEIYGYLVDDIGTVTGHLSEGILITGRQWAERIEQTGLKFVGELRTPPGLHSFRILVRNRQTGRFFLSRHDLEVQSDVGARAYLLPPLVAEPEDSWMVVGQHGLQLTAVRDSFHGLESWPSAMPTWRSEEPLDIILGSSELTASRYASARLVDRVGRPILDPDLEVGPPIQSDSGLAFHHASVAAPDVPAGEYRLEINVTDSNSGTTVSQSLPVLIHDRSTALVWTDPAAPRAVEALSMPPRTEQPSPEDFDEAAMRAAYVETLRLWSHDDALTAKRNLAELERPVEAASSARRWRQLFAIERITTLALARSHPPSLMGVAFLHRDMFRWYLSRRETGLAQHSWQMAAMMARMAPAIDGWNPPAGFTECMLLDLARNLAQAGQLQQARELLQVAIDVAPTSAAALLGLGALYERTGYPAEAVEEFETLVKAHPENHEGRLRLAVNRERLGADRAAEQLFRGLLPQSSPLWIRTVAYQELGRLLVDQGRVEEADQLLREGMTQIPENQRLRILLAHALDQAQRPREATAEIEHLGTYGAQRTTSPRYRYSMWPDIDADRVHSTLAAAEAEGLAALREVLQ